MIDLLQYLTFVAASAFIVIVPGPMVTLIIANSLRHGVRAGLANIAGAQLGLALMVAVVALGLEVIIAQAAHFFDWLRIAGAAYLIWLGLKLLRAQAIIGERESLSTSRSFFVEGFLVMLSNPKALLFLGAFLPQFVKPDGDTLTQAGFLGLTFMLVAAVLDGAYALVAANARRWLSQSNIRRCEMLSGVFLVGGGLWLALVRR